MSVLLSLISFIFLQSVIRVQVHFVVFLIVCISVNVLIFVTQKDIRCASYYLTVVKYILI